MLLREFIQGTPVWFEAANFAQRQSIVSQPTESLAALILVLGEIVRTTTCLLHDDRYVLLADRCAMTPEKILDQ